MDNPILNAIDYFLAHPNPLVEQIYNEHGLQLELGIHLRNQGFNVQFERPFKLDAGLGTAKRPKRELDIFVRDHNTRLAIELKTPLAGRVPESMYDFCADIQFVEQLIENDHADSGVCLLVTNDKQFWNSSLRGEGIYSFFRSHAVRLNGSVGKPTGLKDTTIFIAGSYGLASCWKDLGNTSLLANARYLLAEIAHNR